MFMGPVSDIGIALLIGYCRADARMYLSLVDALCGEDAQAVVARRHGISRWTLRRWMAGFRATAAAYLAEMNLGPEVLTTTHQNRC